VRINESNKRFYTGEAIVNKLIEDIDMNISQAMIQREFDNELKVMQKSNRWSDTQVEEFQATLDMTEELTAAQKKIRRSVILTTIINKENLQATEEDIQKAFSKLNLPADFDISKANMPAIVGRLSLDVVTQKAVDILIDSVSVEYQEVDPAEFEQEHGHVHGPDCNH
jgi:FKBP-type peptidyl-prolyl cis-trans isomerase (trigger factor)